LLYRLATRLTALPDWLLFAILYAAVVVSHLALLRLPYFWDEGGYYIPAALDFYRHGWLIPHFTNAHPPLPNIVLGTLWHLTGFHILATRLIVCAFAAAGLLAVLRLTQKLLSPSAAFAVTLLTAVYPIWFAQSTLAHADIFAAAFTLWAFALYLPAVTQSWVPHLRNGSVVAKVGDHCRLLTALLFTLAALSKETSILQPATLAALELYLVLRDRTNRREHLRWLVALSFPLLPLIAWYAYHHHVTGFTFGNPEYLRYNATANLTVGHVLTSLRYRFLHLFWQRQIWLPITLALACLFLPRRSSSSTLYPLSSIPCFLLVLANWLAFSVLGGALLTRYLLPIYPLILLLCVATWRDRTKLWPVFTAATTVVFISAWWLNPPTSFAPEDNLTYRDMVVAHQQAIDYVAQHYPNAAVLTAWPVSADLFNPDLGYVTRPIKGVSIEDFTRPSFGPIIDDTARTGTARYDTAIVFTTHFLEPNFRHYLETHPNTRRGREFAQDHDLSPEEIAQLLGGQIVFQTNQHGEWAAVLRFNRSYEANLSGTTPRLPQR
jgi:4-amino-4-deoxy-L-arabinose transferase-like glycosyltransferase